MANLYELNNMEKIKEFLIERSEDILKQLGYGLKKEPYKEAMYLELSTRSELCKRDNAFYKKFGAGIDLKYIKIGDVDLMIKPYYQNAVCYIQITVGDSIKDEELIWLLMCDQEINRVYHTRYYTLVLNFPTNPDGKVTCDGFSDRHDIHPKFAKFLKLR